MSEFGGLRKHENAALREENKKWAAPYYGCSFSPGKAARVCRALLWDKTVIESHLISSSATYGRNLLETKSPTDEDVALEVEL